MVTDRIDESATFDVFLSHSRDDAEAVEGLAETLNDAQLDVWLDRWVLVPGGHWQQEMARGLESAKACAVCIGNTTPTGWFEDEIELALSRQTHDKAFRVIPVILPGGTDALIKRFLRLRTWVDFGSGLDDARAIHELTAGIRGLSPGRPSKRARIDDPMESVRTKLRLLRDLRVEILVDDAIAQEYQRRILDSVIGDH